MANPISSSFATVVSTGRSSSSSDSCRSSGCSDMERDRASGWGRAGGSWSMDRNLVKPGLGTPHRRWPLCTSKLSDALRCSCVPPADAVSPAKRVSSAGASPALPAAAPDAPPAGRPNSRSTLSILRALSPPAAASVPWLAPAAVDELLAVTGLGSARSDSPPVALIGIETSRSEPFVSLLDALMPGAAPGRDDAKLQGAWVRWQIRPAN